MDTFMTKFHVLDKAHRSESNVGIATRELHLNEMAVPTDLCNLSLSLSHVHLAIILPNSLVVGMACGH